MFKTRFTGHVYPTCENEFLEPVFTRNICGFSSKFFCRQGKNLQAYFRMARIFNAVCNKICRKDVDRRLWTRALKLPGNYPRSHSRWRTCPPAFFRRIPLSWWPESVPVRTAHHHKYSIPPWAGMLPALPMCHWRRGINIRNVKCSQFLRIV